MMLIKPVVTCENGLNNKQRCGNESHFGFCCTKAPISVVPHIVHYLMHYTFQQDHSLRTPVNQQRCIIGFR